MVCNVIISSIEGTVVVLNAQNMTYGKSLKCVIRAIVENVTACCIVSTMTERGPFFKG